MEQPMNAMPEQSMAPTAEPAAPTGAESMAGVSESLNIAVQAGLEAVQAAAAGGEAIAPETLQKLEAAVLTLAEVQDEMTAAPVSPMPQPGMGAAAPQDARQPM